MNPIIQERYQILQMYQPLRNQLIEILTDEDLRFHPGGENLTLGELCREIGATDYAYIQSFKPFLMDLSYHNDESDLTESVKRERPEQWQA